MSEPQPHRPTVAVIVGTSGGIGSALTEHLRATAAIDSVIGFGRDSDPRLDLTDERSIAEAAAHIANRNSDLRLVIVASGFLHGDGMMPEKALAQTEAAHFAKAFAINATGPALLMKHFLPLFPAGRSVFAAISARVGSIGDNSLGGWYAYRASKAALNQLVHTAAIELKRKRPEAICVAIHPGTVDTKLSAPFAKIDLAVRTPAIAAG